MAWGKLYLLTEVCGVIKNLGWHNAQVIAYLKVRINNLKKLFCKLKVRINCKLMKKVQKNLKI